MARMIPPIIHSDCASFGEKEIFCKLRDEPGTANWIVLHSLGIPRHIRQISGEIDFLIIVPNKGVLCIEVKACSKLSRRDGLWFYGKDSNGDPRGPFKQANQGMHSLRKQLEKDRPDLARVPFFAAVMFPYINFDYRPEEWNEWEVIDRKRFRAGPVCTSILSTMDRWRAHIQSAGTGGRFVKHSTEPYPEQCAAIADYLRGDFEFHEVAKSIITRNADEIARFTQEQFDALDSMERNRRIIFSGAAGTGKTFLALEAAKRAAADDKKVLFICYNKLLGDWLKKASGQFKGIDVFTIHSLMMRISESKVTEDTPMFWEQTLPDRTLNAILEKQLHEIQYDVLIVDEGQDLLHPPYLDVLDLMVAGGLSAGFWRMFGDFERQTIYKTSHVTLDSFKTERCGGVPEARLSVNCRNTPRIGTWVQKVGKLKPGYSRFRREDNGLEPEIVFFKKYDEQAVALLGELNALFEQGFSNQDIVILSPYGQESSAISSIGSGPWKDRLKPFRVDPTGHLGYSTIHAFKGLEAQIVLVTDLDKINDDEDLSLLYVALSRAVHKAVLFISEPLKEKLSKIIFSESEENK